VPRGQRDGSLRPYSRFSRQEPLLLFQVAPQLYSRGWVDPVPDPLLFFGSAGNRTRDPCICSQELWPLDHRGGPVRIILKRISNMFNWFRSPYSEQGPMRVNLRVVFKTRYLLANWTRVTFSRTKKLNSVSTRSRLGIVRRYLISLQVVRWSCVQEIGFETNSNPNSNKQTTFFIRSHVY
jgi:hypothetical protein